MDAINLGFKIERCLGTDKELEEAQQALKKLGVTLTSDDGYLNIRIDNKHGSSGNVGRRKKYAIVVDGSDLKVYKYSDVIYRLCHKSNDTVAKEIGMKIATFYRHKKIMMESNYYKSLDKKKFEDLHYLKSVDGDRIF